MGSMQEIMQLCRLCLMKDQVNTPIFENVDDISQVFIRISACLPIKVSREDALPKNICENCSYKLEIFYELLNTSVASEKQLLAWAKQLGVDRLPKVISTCSLSTTHVRPLVMKQEVSELLDPHSIDDLDASDDLDLTNQTQDYNISQQQLSYETVGFEFQPDQFIDNQTTTDIASKSTPKRKRSAIGLNIDLDSEDDAGLCSSKSAKTDGIHNGESDADDTAFDDLPSTSGENDQPGPSGIGKPSDSSSSKDSTGTDEDSKHNKETETMILCKLENVNQEISSDTTSSETLCEKILQYKCHFCAAMFANYEECNHHKMEHYNQEEYNEEEIELKFDESMLETLKSTCAEAETNELKINTKWNCKKCKLQFLTSTQLRAHRKNHRKPCNDFQYNYKYDEAQQLYTCYTCDFESSNKEEIEKHVVSHEKIFNCNDCGATFITPYEYACHIYNHDKSKPFQCPFCQYNSERRTAIGIHINTFHLRKYIYNCEECGKGFNDCVTYRDHNNIHRGLKPFVCIVCNRDYAFSSYLTHHQIRCHTVLIEGVVGSNQCSFCSKRFSRKSSLQKHIEVHNSNKKKIAREKKHLCDICGQGFSCVEKMRIHYRVHTGIKPYVCSYCSKSFIKRDYLIMHERVHSGEKPYVCKHCGKAFSQGAPLRLHLRIHTGERPYQCHLCKNGFISRGVLNIHLKNCPGIVD